MFERNRVDNSLQQNTVPAEITLADGTQRKGRFYINAARTIYEVLNGETQFVDFESYGGERSLLAKSTLTAIKIVGVPNAPSLKNKVREGDPFDPHAILGVPSEATFEDVRKAYLELSKIYHPDRFSGLALPAEVSSYLAAMARRINAAYQALEAPVQSAKRREAERAKPIFTTAQRV